MTCAQRKAFVVRNCVCILRWQHCNLSSVMEDLERLLPVGLSGLIDDAQREEQEDWLANEFGFEPFGLID